MQATGCGTILEFWLRFDKWDVSKNGILLPKLFWPTVRKNCPSDQEKLLKFEAEGRDFAKFLRSLEQFFLTGGQNNFGNKIPEMYEKKY